MAELAEGRADDVSITQKLRFNAPKPRVQVELEVKLEGTHLCNQEREVRRIQAQSSGLVRPSPVSSKRSSLMALTSPGTTGKADRVSSCALRKYHTERVSIFHFLIMG